LTISARVVEADTADLLKAIDKLESSAAKQRGDQVFDALRKLLLMVRINSMAIPWKKHRNIWMSQKTTTKTTTSRHILTMAKVPTAMATVMEVRFNIEIIFTIRQRRRLLEVFLVSIKNIAHQSMLLSKRKVV
jgi:hypothetical protein